MGHLVPFLPKTAPFTAEQRAWLNGFLAGASTARRDPDQDAPVLPDVTGDGFDGAAALRLPASPPGQAERPPAEKGHASGSLGLPADARRKSPVYDRTNPFPAPLTCRRPLNSQGSSKDTRHVELSLEGSGLSYEVGDALGVVPRNCPDLVRLLIEKLGLGADESVTIDGEPSALFEALERRRDITSVTDAFLRAVAERSGDRDLQELLRHEARQKKRAFLEGRDYLDLLDAFLGVRFEAQEVVEMLRPLRHRLYSISSSPKAHPGGVHLTVGVVRYSVRRRTRKGVCSTYLSERAAKGESVPIFVHRNSRFRLPTDADRPVVMIGPGTGIAPFRAFLQERRETGASGRSWLFFGDRHSATDFLYRGEIEEMCRAGILDRLSTAFSRDQNDKVYVQHRMMECAKVLNAWLEDGAHLYVCGDAERMARDVDAALHRVVEIGGGRTPEESAEYVRQLKRERRYARDVY